MKRLNCLLYQNYPLQALEVLLAWCHFCFIFSLADRSKQYKVLVVGQWQTKAEKFCIKEVS